jgi:hypothetical protein
VWRLRRSGALAFFELPDAQPRQEDHLLWQQQHFIGEATHVSPQRLVINRRLSTRHGVI